MNLLDALKAIEEHSEAGQAIDEVPLHNESQFRPSFTDFFESFSEDSDPSYRDCRNRRTKKAERKAAVLPKEPAS